MKKLINKLYNNSFVRYAMAGAVATAVNIGCFGVFINVFHMERTISNIVSIFLSILVAFFVYRSFVFKSQTTSTVAILGEAVEFIGGRMVTLAIEVVGVDLLCQAGGLDAMVSKLFTQVIVLVINFFISKFIVFNKKKQDKSIKEWYKDNHIYVLTTGISALVMLGVWIFAELRPFGDNSFIIVDGLHQYMPFFSEYYDKLTSGSSFFYTWDIGLGMNFVSLWSYYLSSPFNLLILFFKKENLTIAVCLIVTIKIVLSSLSFAVFLCNRGEKVHKDLRIVVFSLAYGFSNYIIGYYWNVMWMDCIMILPILILGLERLIKHNDGKLYVLCLFYSLVSNYYIGYMVCIFMVMWFFMSDFKDFKTFVLRGIKFAACSLIAAAMGAFMLLPAYKGIMATASAKGVEVTKNWYGSICAILKAYMVYTEPINNQTFDGGVNLYCGVIAVFLVIIGLLSNKQKLNKKIRYAIALAFLLMSFNNEWLNYIWHGMHNQYGIPNRFSFIYVFIIILLAYETFMALKAIKLWQVITAYAAMLVATIYIVYSTNSEFLGPEFIGTVTFLTMFLIAFMLCTFTKLNYRYRYYILTSVIFLEVITNTIVGFAQGGVVDTTKYFSDTHAIENVKNYVGMDDPYAFYRTELVKSKILDEATWHNLKSIGVFGSTVRGEVTTLMGRMGFYTGANEYLYRGATPLTSSITNVRYILEREGDYNSSDFKYVGTLDGISIYENPYYLSLGFIVDDDLLDWNFEGGNSFDVQNSFVKNATGQDRIFTRQTFELKATGHNVSTEVSGSNAISYTRNQNNDCSIDLSFDIAEDMDLYTALRGGNIKEITLYINGELKSCDRYQLQTFHVGRVSAGDNICINYKLNDSPDSGVVRIEAASFDEEVYKKAYEEMADEILCITYHTSSRLDGYISSKEGGLVYTSVPYDEGFTLYVDNVETPIEKIGNAFIGFHVDEGSHIVKLQYVPVGLLDGVRLSVAAWAIFVLAGLISHRRRKEKVNE